MSRTTVLKWVREAGESCKDSIKVNLELNPFWFGILCVDGKSIAIAGRKYTVLVAVDKNTRDLVHFRIVESENEEGFENFLLEIRDIIQYPLMGMVSDLGKGKVLIKLVAKIFPDIPHQLCVVHYSRYVDFILPKSKKSKYHQENTLLRKMVNRLLFASSLSEANYYFNKLKRVAYLFTVSYQKTIIRSVISYYPLLTKHFRCSYLPRDNNAAEGVIKQLNKKLLLAEGYLTKESAFNHLKLWSLCYRFKPFSDSRIPNNNGKSPLQLAKVDTSKIHWLDYSNALSRPS